MSLRLRLLDNKKEIDECSTVIEVVCLGEHRYAVLEETFGEGSAEGESWRPVEVLL